MTKLPRYFLTIVGSCITHERDARGNWCEWADVELALKERDERIKELQQTRALYRSEQDEN